VLVYCHAGCTQDEVIAALRTRGLWPTAVFGAPARRARSSSSVDAPSADSVRRSEHAMALWDQGLPIAGSVAETYLRSRGIAIEAPPALRFHEKLKHGPTDSCWPALLGLITDSVSAKPIGLHRTFLTFDGSGKAPIEPAKMMLGRAHGVVVRLGEVTDQLMVAEGIETALSVQQACSEPVWAALSASGLKSLNLPPGINSITILADGDPTGEAAALDAARRLKTPVRSVRIVRTPAGRDFNDILCTSAKRKSDA
jgi:putative DNA primase/helicase